MKVLVTGAAGHLGFNLVRELLDAGHEVRAGVRDPSDGAVTGRLRALGPLDVVQTELQRPACLGAAMDGVEVVFHAAAVYALCAPARAAEMLDISVAGTSAVLRAASRARVRKVVLTSSVLAVPLTPPGAAPSTEDDWNTDLRVPYVRAKTEGERAAWTLAAELGLPLAAVLPGSFAGPGFVRGTPTTDLIDTMRRGGFRAGVPAFNLPYVDVRDVAVAHRLAGERDVEGRFIVVNDELPDFRAVVEALHRLDPQTKPPLAVLPDWALPAVPLFDRLNAMSLGTPRTATRELVGMMRGRRYNASNHRARDLLGWRPRIGLAQSLRDTLVALDQLGRERYASRAWSP
jgi:dihydroflavonol-4-reductase